MKISSLVRHRLFWPIVALFALILVNTLSRPTFLSITVKDGGLYGSLIDILRNSSQLMLVALGMTLVIATRGIDLSVGAVLAVSGAVSLTLIGGASNPGDPGTVAAGILLGLVVALVLGAWNGLLVSVVKIQPIIATLLLMFAGRGIAMLVTKGQITTITSNPYALLASGHLFGLPVAFLIAAVVVAVIALVVRRTALGMLLEAVGINPEASRLAGVQSRGIIWTVYVVSGLLAGMSGILYSSNIMAADANNAGLNIEVDAILAVVIGGTSLAGGKFSISGTVIGVLILQTLTASITFLGIPPAVTPVFKAIVVIAICLAQSRKVRGIAFARTRRRIATTATTTDSTSEKESVLAS